jgi:processing peptidase subunit beta
MASGGNVGSKLAQLSGQHGLCHSFQAFNTCYADTGLWGVYFVTDKNKIDDFMIALQNEWFKIIFRIFDLDFTFY